MRRIPTVGVLRYVIRTIAVVTVLGVLGVLGVTAVGCGVSTSSENSENSENPGTLSGELTVSAAASLQGAFTEIAAAFEQVHPKVDVVLNFGASSTLARQIIAAAPVDVFASADDANMQKVSDADLVDGPPSTFATNSLTIIVRKGNPSNVSTLADLARPGVVYVSCAPDVPIGAYSAQILQQAGITVRTASFEPDVKGIVAKVSSGEADAGIVYASDIAATKGAATGVAITPDANITVTYPIATIATSKKGTTAQAWISFVIGAEGQQILRQNGFGAP